MKISSYPLITLVIACLSSLVSCYPIEASQSMQNRNSAQVANNAKAKADAADLKVKQAISPFNSTLDSTSNSNNSIPSYSNNTGALANNSVAKLDPVAVKPAMPAVVKFAAPVPEKDGFVFNPYTHNQVDVRGIPSGTKVRDPHDPNSAHVFKVP